MCIARHSVVLTIALVIGLLVFAGLAQADDIAWKSAHDTDPHLALTAEQLEMTAEKRAAEPQGADAFLPALVGPLSECGGCTGGGTSYPTSTSLVANQTPQATSYYCGPAAIHEALGAVGVSLSQSAAAVALHTTTGGTAWSGGGTSPLGYPVPDVLNRYQSRNYYVPQPVSSATSSAIATYERDLKMDIYALGVPLIGDVGGPGWLSPRRTSRQPADLSLVRDPRLPVLGRLDDVRRFRTRRDLYWLVWERSGVLGAAK